MLNLLLSLIYKYTYYKSGEYPLSILYYHHIFAQFEKYHPDDLCAQAFDRQINFLNKKFNILPMNEAVNLLKQGNLPPKALVISFDDGYLDNYTVATPILEKYNCPATFFISTDGVDKGYLWNDVIEQTIKKTSSKSISKNIIGTTISLTNDTEKIAAFHKIVSTLKFFDKKERNERILSLSKELNIHDFSRSMMNQTQILDLHKQGFTIGAHTHSHTILTTETDNECKWELSTNKNFIGNIIDSPVDFLAFPNGLFQRDFNQSHCDIAKELGFKAAFSTNDGGAISSTNTYQIPRFMPYRKQLPLFVLSIAKIAGEHV